MGWRVDIRAWKRYPSNPAPRAKLPESKSDPDHLIVGQVLASKSDPEIPGESGSQFVERRPLVQYGPRSQQVGDTAERLERLSRESQRR